MIRSHVMRLNCDYQEPDGATGAVVPPISLATTFAQVKPSAI